MLTSSAKFRHYCMSRINLKHLIPTVFILSWLGVVPGLLFVHGYPIPESLRSFHILMTLGPILGAILFIYRSYGLSGIAQFFRRLLRFRASLPAIVVALIAPVIICTVAPLSGFKISGTSWPSGFTASSVLENGIILFLMYLFINTEEWVWRGIVFEKLLGSYSFIKSCFLLMPIWWIFHVPLFLFPSGHQAGYGLVEFTCIVVAETIILGWIYVKTNRSLLYVHLHHQLLNGFSQAFPLFPVFIGGNTKPLWVFCILLLLLATGLLKTNMNRDRKQPVPS